MSLDPKQRVGQSDVRLEVPGLISVVFQNDVAPLVLKVPKTNQDNIALVDPHLKRKAKREGAFATSQVACVGMVVVIAERRHRLVNNNTTVR
jgi:hypothetical protein